MNLKSKKVTLKFSLKKLSIRVAREFFKKYMHN